MSDTHHPRTPRKAAFAARILTAIAGQPGITVPELARHLGCAQTRLKRVLQALAADGKVRQDRGSWYPVDGAAA